MSAAYKWKPIEDLPQDATTLTDAELEALHLVWNDQKLSLEQSGVLEKFYGEIQREWGIETGVIERVYTLDRGTTQLLIEHGIDAALIPHEATNRDPQQVARIIQDHVEALEGMYAFVSGQRKLTTGYIKELHAALLRHQETVTAVDQFDNLLEKPLEKGSYKKSPNNPRRLDGSVHEYCPPEHVASEMDRMILLHGKHSERSVPPEVEAAWMHHVFTQIHPFEDGNGRVARAIASLILIKAGWFPLVITRDDKYIDALEVADGGDLRPLISLFAQTQKRALIKAGEVAYELKPPQTVEEAIAAARDRLVSRGQIPPRDWMKAKETAQALFNLASQRLASLMGRLNAEIGVLRPGFQFTLGSGTGGLPVVVGLATQLDYLPNLGEYHQWSQLALGSGAETITVSFHAVGAKYRGLLAALVLFQRQGISADLATDDVFQINYKEDLAQAQKRFEPWLEKSLARALTLWRSGL